MKLILFLIAIILAVAFAAKLLLATSPIKFYIGTLPDIEPVYHALRDTGKNGSYAIFAFRTTKALPNSHIELQYSIENEKIGFDWVLIGEEKNRDKEAFISLAKDRGHDIQYLSGNGVDYIRIENGNLIRLCKDVMIEMYSLKPEEHFEVIAKKIATLNLPLSK